MKNIIYCSFCCSVISVLTSKRSQHNLKSVWIKKKSNKKIWTTFKIAIGLVNKVIAICDRDRHFIRCNKKCVRKHITNALAQKQPIIYLDDGACYGWHIYSRTFNRCVVRMHHHHVMQQLKQCGVEKKGQVSTALKRSVEVWLSETSSLVWLFSGSRWI